MKNFILFISLLFLAGTAKSQTAGDTVYFSHKARTNINADRTGSPLPSCDSLDISGMICCKRDRGGWFYDVKPVINNWRKPISSWSIHISSGTVVGSYLPAALGTGTWSVFQPIHFINVSAQPLIITFIFKYADGKSCSYSFSLTPPHCGKP